MHWIPWLTARVMANRIWHHHFGRGIVATLDNFGKMGDAPTDPALLDWLAEVVEGRDDAAAEMMVPDPIGHHARGQRILRRGEPFGQRPPPS